MPRLVGGEESRPCNRSCISRKPRPVGGELHSSGGNHLVELLHNLAPPLEKEDEGDLNVIPQGIFEIMEIS
jgi:hypothetical protein